MKLISKYVYNIFTVISISIIFRLLLINTYGDTTLDNEWGTLFYNLKNYGVLAYRTFDEFIVPSVYMPPLYVYFIYIVDVIIPESLNLVKTILFIQIILSSVYIYFFYKINLNQFSKKISIISTYIFSLFPLNTYSCLQISSITLQIFLIIIFLYLILKIFFKKKAIKTFLILGFISGLSILLRGEFIIIFFFTIIYLLYLKKINLSHVISIFIITILTISPYMIRNYISFEKVTITKSFGYNLWKGNNIDSQIEGSESDLAFSTDNIRSRIKNLEKNNLYEFEYDKIFLDNTLKFIKEDKVLFFERFFKKFLAFLFFNIKSNYPNYYHPLNIIPLIILSFVSLISIIFIFIKNKSNYINYLFLNLILTLLVFSLFFILPRYKLIILPIQLILINHWLNSILKKGV